MTAKALLTIWVMRASLSMMVRRVEELSGFLTVSGRGDKDVETYLSHKEMAGEYGNF